MCRFAAYIGPPQKLSGLLYDAPHALERQAYVPRQMLSGHVNVDGTGVAWWVPGDSTPLRYVSAGPPWSEPNLPGLSRRLDGSTQLAVVRSQTPGMPAGVGSAHPFVFGDWAGAHNGYVEGFDRLKWTLVERLDPVARKALEVVSDSAVLFLLAVSHLRGGATLTEAALAAVDAVTACLEAGSAASLNVVLAAEDEVVAVRLARGVEPNTLYRGDGGARWPGGRLIASEPLDGDQEWSEVPPDHLLRMTPEGFEQMPVAPLRAR